MIQPPGARARILVVESEARTLQAVSAALEAADFLCECYDTIGAAEAAAERNPPDLILSDTTLHGENAVELCARLRQDPRLHHVPVMFLSAGQMPDVIRRSDAGVGTYYLRKPCDTYVLVELVRRALSPAPAFRPSEVAPLLMAPPSLPTMDQASCV